MFTFHYYILCLYCMAVYPNTKSSAGKYILANYFKKKPWNVHHFVIMRVMTPTSEKYFGYFFPAFIKKLMLSLFPLTPFKSWQ